MGEPEAAGAQQAENEVFEYPLGIPKSFYGLCSKEGLLPDYYAEMGKYMTVSVETFLAEFRKRFQESGLGSFIAGPKLRGDGHYFIVTAASPQVANEKMRQYQLLFMQVAMRYAIPGSETKLRDHATLTL
jgi:hypothetical protein